MRRVPSHVRDTGDFPDLFSLPEDPPPRRPFWRRRWQAAAEEAAQGAPTTRVGEIYRELVVLTRFLTGGLR